MQQLENEQPKRRRGERKVSPHSFSLDPKLYKMFHSSCKERGINMSAWLRNAMVRQMKTWRLGEHDEYLMDGED